MARKDRVLVTRCELTAQLAVLVVEHVAEEIVLEDPNTGQGEPEPRHRLGR